MGLYEQTEQFKNSDSLISIKFEGNTMETTVQNVSGAQMAAAIIDLVDTVIETSGETGVELASMIAARAVMGGKK